MKALRTACEFNRFAVHYLDRKDKRRFACLAPSLDEAFAWLWSRRHVEPYRRAVVLVWIQTEPERGRWSQYAVVERNDAGAWSGANDG